MKAAVVGAGWAGLAAALRLRELGWETTLFEAGREPGGRARSVDSATLGMRIDNGQHILLGAYTETLALMRELGIDPEQRLQRLGLGLRSADGRYRLQAWPRLPRPLHLLAGIATARGLGWPDRCALAALMRRLQRQLWQTPPAATVEQWLRAECQSDRLMRRFWRPLCLAALNTAPQEACAQLLAHVLRDSLGGPRSASDMLLPRTGLSELWPADAAALLDIRYGHAVRRLAWFPTHVELDGMAFDAAILASNVPVAQRLLRQCPSDAAGGLPAGRALRDARAPGSTVPGGTDSTAGTPRCAAAERTLSGAAFLDELDAFDYRPIATLTLRLARPWNLPWPMLMLEDDPARDWHGQWLFERPPPRPGIAAAPGMPDGAGSPDAPPAATVVVSDARTAAQLSRTDLAAGIQAQLRAQSAALPPMPEVIASELLVDKRATFAAVPGLARPGNATPWPRIWVAGDWTDTGYPAVLEGAVRSGRRAAALAVSALAGGRSTQ